MNKTLFLKCMLSAWLLLVSQSLFARTFFEQHQKGWFWYERFDPQKKLRKTPLNPTQRMQALQQTVEQSLNLAILEPTEAHLKTFAEHYFRAIHQAQSFTDGYQLMLLNNPALDYGLRFPTAPKAQALYVKEQQANTRLALQGFASTQGLFFFFKGNCPYCKIFAPVVQAFAKDYGITVLPISLDGTSLPGFEKSHNNQAIAALLKVQQVPFLAAVDPRTQVITPLAQGAIAYSQLEENVKRVLRQKEEALHGPR
jgi:conjugal transfer pilus assembly protein TraF